MGSLWMLLAAFLFACMSVLVKFGAMHFLVPNLCFIVRYLEYGPLMPLSVPTAFL